MTIREALEKANTALQRKIDDALTKEEIKNCMEHWDDLSFDDKRAVVDQIIVKIKVTEDTCVIEWKI